MVPALNDHDGVIGIEYTFKKDSPALVLVSHPSFSAAKRALSEKPKS